uniref:Uncharacterized protein LOC114332387 n=1 Tax=Diabrotica virgifera virgifera TaxID=50390 RepID=A0A6P7FP65_DIAVI
MDTQDDSLDDAEFSDLLQSRPSTPHLEELLKDAEERNFALVKFPTEGGGKEAYYIGHVVKIKENEEISCLRKSHKCENKFFFPNVPDKAVIEKGQVVYILKPTLVSGTKRQQSTVTFEVNLKNYL